MVVLWGFRSSGISHIRGLSLLHIPISNRGFDGNARHFCIPIRKATLGSFAGEFFEDTGHLASRKSEIWSAVRKYYFDVSRFQRNCPKDTFATRTFVWDFVRARWFLQSAKGGFECE